MTVPKNCRPLPLTGIQALPTAPNGQCFDNPKTEDLVPFCQETVSVFFTRELVGSYHVDVSAVSKLE
jgi:hypothetical protein